MTGTADRTLELLLQLCEWQPPEITRQRISDNDDKEAFEKLVSVGALGHVDNVSSLVCTECDDSHAVAVEMVSPGRFRAYCPEAGYYNVTADDLRLFGVDFSWLVERIARGLGISQRVQTRELIPSVLWHLGQQRFGKSMTAVYFGRLLDRREISIDIESTIKELPPGPAILFTSTPLRALLRNRAANCLVLQLAEYADLRSDRLVFDAKVIERALKGVTTAEQFPAGRVRFSPDYRHATVDGEVFSFTPKQADAVRVMHVAHLQGTPRLSQRHILAAAESDQERMGHLFRGHPAFGTFILYDGKGFYWLDL